MRSNAKVTLLPDGYIRDANNKVIPGKNIYVKLWRMVHYIEGGDSLQHHKPVDSWRKAKRAYYRYLDSIGAVVL